MRDAATQLSLSRLKSCLTKKYTRPLLQEASFWSPIISCTSNFLRTPFIELYSLDVPRSCIKALVSIQQLATILRQCLHTKKKETMEKKIYSWQYINSVELWV